MLTRLLVGALALLVLAWLAVSLRDARLQQDGREAIRTLEASKAAGARRDFDGAGLLNPDRSPQLDDGLALIVQGRRTEGLARLLAFARREPENADAWILIAQLAGRGERELETRARARAKELDPRWRGAERSP